MGFREFIYREKNKRLLRRLFINGRGRVVGKALYTGSVATELGIQRFADWLVPRAKTDQSYLADNLTAIVKTFERPALLARLVSSIRRTYPGLSIIVVDDSRDPISLRGVETVILPFNSGLGAGRNAGLDLVKTPYTLVLDDDYVFYRKTRLIEALKMLIDEPRIDIMGGARVDLPFYRVVDYSKIGLFPSPAMPVLPHGSFLAGLPVQGKVANFFIARTESLRKVMWDGNLKKTEHADFFTRAKGQLVTVYNKKMRVLHARTFFDDGYLKYREDGGDSEYLREKYYGRGKPTSKGPP